MDVSNDVLATIRADLLRYEFVFTTSYDLILYWAMGAGPRGWFLPLVDLFKSPGLRFDPSNADPDRGQIPVYFLHGALHLVVGGDGVTWKLRWAAEPLLERDRAREALVELGLGVAGMTARSGR